MLESAGAFEWFLGWLLQWIWNCWKKTQPLKCYLSYPIADKEDPHERSEIVDVSCNGFCKVLVGCIDWSAMVLVMTYNSSCRGLAVEMCILRMVCNGSELWIYSGSCRGFCKGPLQSEPCHQLACFYNVQQNVFYPQSLLDWTWCRMQWRKRGSSSPNGLLCHHNLPPRLAPERLLWHLGQPSYTRHGLEQKLGWLQLFLLCRVVGTTSIINNQ